ncbi:hypothetical protein Tco_1107779 [Tanacetum coccineum]
MPRDELVLQSQQLVLLEENSLYCSRLQLPVLNQSVNTARITAVGEKVNAAESLLVVSFEIVDNCKKGLGYNAVPPPYTGNFMPSTHDLSFTGLDEFIDKPVIENRKFDEEVV